MRRLLAITTVLALLTAACGDDVLSPDGTDAPATTAAADGDTTPATEADEATTSTAGPAPTEPDGPGDPGDAAGIDDLLEIYESVPLRLTYRFDSGGDEPDLLTLSQDPTQDPPVSATMMGEDGEEGKFITIGDRSIICDPSAGECMELPGGMDMGAFLLGPMMAGFLFAEGITDVPGLDVQESGVQIAGRSGVCFTYDPTQFDPTADVAGVRQCIDSELGFILLVEEIEGGTTSNLMELVEFGDPRPEDFEPTGPLTTMPGG